MIGAWPQWLGAGSNRHHWAAPSSAKGFKHRCMAPGGEAPWNPGTWSLQEHSGGIFPTAASMLGRVEKPASFIAKPHLKCLQRLRLLHPILGLPPHLHIPLAGAVQCPAPILQGKPPKNCCPQQCNASSKMQRSY